MYATATKDNPTHSPSKPSQPFFAPAPHLLRQEGEKNGHTPFFPPRPQPLIQAKLTINEPGDKYEQEADAMAERVVRSPSPTPPAGGAGTPAVQRLCFTTIPVEVAQRSEKPAPHFLGNEPIVVQRKCADCEQEEKVQRQEMEEEEEPLQTKRLPAQGGTEGGLMRKSAAGGGYTASPQLTSQLDSSKSGGDPLPGKTLGFMNQAFGADFSSVRIHAGAQAAEMSQGIQAKAFTHGSDIYFNRGQYSPESSEGKRLLGHELTHVVQQGNVIQKSSKDSPIKTNNTDTILIQRDTIKLSKLKDVIEDAAIRPHVVDWNAYNYYVNTKSAIENIDFSKDIEWFGGIIGRATDTLAFGNRRGFNYESFEEFVKLYYDSLIAREMAELSKYSWMFKAIGSNEDAAIYSQQMRSLQNAKAPFVRKMKIDLELESKCKADMTPCDEYSHGYDEKIKENYRAFAFKIQMTAALALAEHHPLKFKNLLSNFAWGFLGYGLKVAGKGIAKVAGNTKVAAPPVGRGGVKAAETGRMTTTPGRGGSGYQRPGGGMPRQQKQLGSTLGEQRQLRGATIGHTKTWSSMSKKEQKAFRHSYDRHKNNNDLGLPKWEQKKAEKLRQQFSEVVGHIRNNAQKQFKAYKPVSGKTEEVWYFQYTDRSGMKYYYFETLKEGRFVSAGKER